MNIDKEVTDYKIFGYEFHTQPEKMIELYIAYNTTNPKIKSSLNAFCMFNKELNLYELSTLDNRCMLNLLLEDNVIAKIDNKYYLNKSALVMLI